MNLPIRSSKKIGLTQGGRVKNGKACEKWPRRFSKTTWEKLSDEPRSSIIVKENPSKNYFHPSSPEQIQSVLNELPTTYTKNIEAIILRRIPKSDVRLQVDARRWFRCIILNAFPRDLRMVWLEQPSSRIFRHFTSGCNGWKAENGTWYLEWTLPEIQRYYLYHLLLHEIGHLHDGFHNRRKRREDFAENFAREWARKLGQLPILSNQPRHRGVAASPVNREVKYNS